MDKAEKLVAEISEIWAKADQEGRPATPAERGQVAKRLDEIKAIRERSDLDAAMARIEGNGTSEIRSGDGSGPPIASDAGRAFVESDGFKSIQDPTTRGQRWSTGAIPVGSFQTKGTLLEGAGAPGAGSGGGLLPVPTVVPGVVEKLFQPIQVTDLFATITTYSNTVRYAIEGTATSGAAGVAEGAAKPESTLGLSTVDEPVKKIATSITVSDELLEDAAAAQGFVGSRLTLFVQLEEERQLLRGAGTNELVGVVGRNGVNTYGAGTDDNVTAIAKVIGNTAGSSFVMPKGIVMHPVNWLASRLVRDGAGGTVGAYFGGGPFGVAAQNAGAAGLFGQTLWDLPVALSNTVGLGTAIVGGFANAAAIARRGGPRFGPRTASCGCWPRTRRSFTA
jgi:HK97 family phage major capsid protein